MTHRTANITNLLAGRVTRPAIPAANSRDACENAFAVDLAAAEDIIDPRDLPLVMTGPDSTRKLDEMMARVACGGCGQPKPSSAASDDRTPSRGNDSPIDAKDACNYMGARLINSFGPTLVSDLGDIIDAATADPDAARALAMTLCRKFSAAVLAEAKVGGVA